MRANRAHLNFNDGCQKEHEKQQEILKAMPPSLDKVQMVSSDQLIENLLKDPFKKLVQTPVPDSSIHFDHLYVELPSWLQCENDAVPAHYKYLWSLVNSKFDLADTQKVSQLLLTSGLQVDVLGYIWNLANKKTPGQLTKQEFYIVLALVGLAQSGYTFHNLSVLKLMTMPLIPILKGGLPDFQAPQFSSLECSEATDISSSKKFHRSFALQSKPLLNLNKGEKHEDNLINSTVNVAALYDFKKGSVNQKKNSETDLMPSSNISKDSEHFLIERNKELFKSTNFPCIGSSPTAELEDDFSAFQSVRTINKKQCESVNQSLIDLKDDFTEFQSAVVENLDPFEAVVINQENEVPKIPLPKTSFGKFTNLKSTVLKISPETEKKLKFLSQSESLSSLPESKISSNNRVSTCLSVLGSDHGVCSRLEDQTVRIDTGVDRTKCHKHHKINLNLVTPISSCSENEIFLRSKPKDLEGMTPKCIQNNCKTFILKETKISINETGSNSSLKQITNEPDSTDVHSGKNTRQIEIPMLGTFNETVLPTQSNSQSSTFDLITVQEDKYSALRNIELTLNQEKISSAEVINDDFGDFLSADAPANPEPEFSSAFTHSLTSNSDSTVLTALEKDDWGDWNFNFETNLYPSHISNSDTHTNTIPYMKEASTFRPESDLFEEFTPAAISKECKNLVSEPDLFLKEKQNYFGKSDNVNDIIKFNEKLENCGDISSQLQDQPFRTQADSEFWEYLNSNPKPQSKDVSRQNSLTSLDLKITPIEELEQETIWRKCLDSCHSLIQEGYAIFNNIGSKCVLNEVFAAPKTEMYLNNLNIVFQISRRVTQNFNIFPSLQEELEKLWVKLQDLCVEYNIKFEHDEDNCPEGKVRCNICFRCIGCNVINQGSNSYHPSCANFWINCIEPTLPF